MCDYYISSSLGHIQVSLIQGCPHFREKGVRIERFKCPHFRLSE